MICYSCSSKIKGKGTLKTTDSEYVESGAFNVFVNVKLKGIDIQSVNLLLFAKLLKTNSFKVLPHTPRKFLRTLLNKPLTVGRCLKQPERHTKLKIVPIQQRNTFSATVYLDPSAFFIVLFLLLSRDHPSVASGYV